MAFFRVWRKPAFKGKTWSAKQHEWQIEPLTRGIRSPSPAPLQSNTRTEHSTSSESWGSVFTRCRSGKILSDRNDRNRNQRVF